MTKAVARIFGRTTSSDGTPKTSVPSHASAFAAPTFASGKDPQARTQLAQYRQWVYAAVSVRSSRVATAPVTVWKVARGDARERWVQLPDHQIMRMIGRGAGHRPNPITSAYNFRRLTQIDLDLAGNAFWLVRRDGLNVPVELWRLRPDLVTVLVADNGTIEGYEYRYSRTQKALTFNTQDVVHYKYPNPLDDHVGWSPLRAAAYAYDIDLFHRIYQREYFASGTQLGTTLTTDQPINEKQAEEIKRRMENSHGGVLKAWRLAVLGHGLKPVAPSVTNQDVQAVEMMELSRDDILAIYGVPKSKLGLEERTGLTRATAEAADVTFARETIAPLLRNQEQQIEADLLPQFPAPPGYRYELEYDLDIPRDRDADLSEEQARLEHGVLTINEVRAEMGKEPVSWGKNPWMPLNTMQVGDDTDPDPPDDPDRTRAEDDDEPPHTEREKRLWTARVRRAEAHEEKVAEAMRDEFRIQEQGALDALERGLTPELVAEAAAGDESVVRTKEMLRRTTAELIAEEVHAAKELVGRAEEVPETRQDVEDLEVQNLIQRWSALAGNRISGISRTTWDRIKRELEDGLANEESLEELAGRIQGVFGNARRRRALDIARTETIGAANFSAMETYRAEGMLWKVWITALDDRRRDEHRAAGVHGQTVPIGDSFRVGGEDLMFPGDPTGSAENVISCRCIVLPAQGPDAQT